VHVVWATAGARFTNASDKNMIFQRNAIKYFESGFCVVSNNISYKCQITKFCIDDG